MRRPLCATTLSFLAGLVIASLGLSPSPAMADCQAWQLPSIFNAVQANGFNVVFELGGDDRWRAHYFAGDDFSRVDGDALVDFDGNALTIQVNWNPGSPNDTLGLYEGRVDSSGSFSGVTRNLSSPGSDTVHFRSRQIFQCAVVAKPAESPPVSEADRSGILTRPSDDLSVLLPKPQGLSGIWDTVTSSGGGFTLTLNTDGNRVTGSFGHADARFDGTLEGDLNAEQNRFTFTFSQPQLGVTGQGSFSLVARDAIDGRFTVNEGPGNVFLWTGTRRQ